MAKFRVSVVESYMTLSIIQFFWEGKGQLRFLKNYVNTHYDNVGQMYIV